MKSKKSKKSYLVEIFDILFIMLLCFITLFTTMIMRGKVIVGSNSGEGMKYTFNIVTFLMVVAVLTIYMLFIIRHSDKELKGMIREVYGDKAGEQSTGEGEQQ